MITVGRATYRVAVAGIGLPVVMHPSLGRSARDFDVLAARLAGSGYCTVMVDPPGIGSRLGDHSRGDLHSLANDLWQVIDQLRLGPVTLVGHAFGNRLVRTAASDRPGAVSAVVLLACGGEIPPDASVWEILFACFDANLTDEEHLEAVATSFFAPGNDARAWRDGWYPDVAAVQRAAVNRTDPEDFLEGGHAPMLVIQGLDDRIAPPQNAWNLAERRGDTRVLGLPRCAHAILPEQPLAVGDATVSFLREVL